MTSLRLRSPRSSSARRPRGSLDQPSRTITVEPLETPVPAQPPAVPAPPAPPRREPERPPARERPSAPTR
jgi:hypothetical protein